MTILVAYVPRPEGRAALEQGIEIARERGRKLMVVNAGPGGGGQDEALADAGDVERVEKMLASAGIESEFRQFVRGNDAVVEIEQLVLTHHIELVVIGLRRRSAVGKALLGSAAYDILMTVSCPVLAVKAR